MVNTQNAAELAEIITQRTVYFQRKPTGCRLYLLRNERDHHNLRAAHRTPAYGRHSIASTV